MLGAAAEHGVRVITRVVDYGGVFHDDVRPGHEFAQYDHRRFRPDGWVESGVERLERMRPYAERHGLTMLQLACQWNLAHPAVQCVAPTLIQEAGPGARPIEDKRAELAALSRHTELAALSRHTELAALSRHTEPAALPRRAEPAALPQENPLSDQEVAELRAIGDNTGCMALKGASAEYEGPALPDRWPLTAELVELGERWGIETASRAGTTRS